MELTKDRDWPKVTVIILNWNGWRDTIECLESLYQITYPNYDVVVVDNGSQDESIQKIKEYCEGKINVKSNFLSYEPSNKPIEIIEYTKSEAEDGKERTINGLSQNGKMILIKNEQNYGFSEGNNIAIKYAIQAFIPDYVLLLNNDTVVDKDFLGELVKAGESDENVGIVGAKIYYYHLPEIVQSIGVNFDFWKGGTQSLGKGKSDSEINQISELIDVDYVFGACFLIKKEVIIKIGLLDPTLFLYGEETDWSLRAQKAGYRSVTCLKSKIRHKSQASSSKNARFSIYFPVRNRILFLRRYSSGIQLIFSIIYFICFKGVEILYVKKLKKENIKYLFQGIVDGIFISKNQRSEMILEVSKPNLPDQIDTLTYRSQ
jgi:GT2 family glycosyltransferase